MKSLIIFLCLLVIYTGRNPVAVAQVNEQDSLALAALYDSTNGADWTNNTNWLTGNVSSWYGVTVSGDRVTGLELFNNNLADTLPSSIGNLSALQILSLSLNRLSGSIPTEIGNLSKLRQLYLAQNQLGGSIPLQIGNLTDLTQLNLQANQLTGSIPPQIGLLTKLQNLILSNNRLSGEIPAGIQNLVNLTELTFYNNQLTGLIPSGIHNLINLKTLNLSLNQLTGTIPSEIGMMTNLTALSIGGNQLNGSIPPEIGNLSKLYYLYLAANKHTGTIPAEIGNLVELQSLYLNVNELSGSIPSEIGNLLKLETLHLNNNQLSGKLPAAFYNLNKLRSMRLGSNQFADSISALTGNFLDLYDWRIENNHFYGALPATVGELAELQTWYLQGNDFTDLPDLSNDTSLVDLDIANNRFSFEDIEPNTFIPYFYYSPQDSIGTNIDTVVTSGSQVILEIAVGGSANQYQWVKDGEDMPGADSSVYTIPSVEFEDSGSYYCKVTNTIAADLTLYSRSITVTVAGATNVTDQAKIIPRVYALHQNFPNPFNPKTQINYQLPHTTNVTLTVYNLTGQKVATLVNRRQAAGHYQVKWDASTFSSGAYLYRLQTGDFVETKKLILIK